MKTILLSTTLLLYAFVASCQTGTSTFLTWMKGDNQIEQPGIYGTKGVTAISNKPGARDFSATWRDAQGNLWLFGGYGYDANNNLGYLNDLWKFDPLTNSWTWVKGDNIAGQSATYGVQGQAQDANKPGASYASVSWTDASGQLWLYGGFGFTSNGFGFRNDLWKYNPATNQWTWMKGNNTMDQVAVYGIKGTPHNNNKPGARYGSRTWTDNNGNLWLFGGYGYDRANPGTLNDLWKYTPATNKWTWINGDDMVGRYSSYGTKGVASSGNKPGGRYVSISWTDTDGNFWLFGGYGNDASREGYLNDLWKYNTATNQWMWISGDSTTDQKGVYGSLGVASSSNKPGARYVSVSWADSNNDLWLFGGYGFDKTTDGYLNDLWKYDAGTNEWTWVKGDNTINQTGVYGMQGMPTFTNKSGARTSCVSWTDNLGHLWLFGGYGYDASSSGLLNDLWKISSLQVLPVQLTQFDGLLKDNRTHLHWKSSQEINFSHYEIQKSYNGTDYTTLASINGKGKEINEYASTDAEGITSHFTKVYYRLELKNTDGRSTFSKTLVFNTQPSSSPLQLYPNPVSQAVNVSFDVKNSGPVSFTITNTAGATIKVWKENLSMGRQVRSMDVKGLPAGMYVMTVRSGEEVRSVRMVKGDE